MKKEFDCVALGELLIDFTQQGESKQGNPVMEANPGGAPGNVLAMLNRMGHKTAFIGKVGEDIFGRQLLSALQEVGIETRGVVVDPDHRTTLAFVRTLPGGDREFSFYRNPGADMLLKESELDRKLLENCSIFHFGTLSMTHDDVRKATRLAVTEAKKAGALISFDPNIRESLWSSMDLAREQVLWGIEQCDILKISDNEIEWLTGETDYDKGVEWIRGKADIPLILVTLGAEGSRAYMGKEKVEVPAHKSSDTIETTGAGDTFGACVQGYILEHGFHDYSQEELKDMLSFANTAAYIVTTRKGALRVMPSREEVEALR